jgi:hypothetical protein
MLEQLASTSGLRLEWLQKLTHFLVVLGTCIMGSALLGLGVLCMLAPGVAGELYGLPGLDKFYVIALGFRDLGLGSATLAIFAIRPSSLRVFVPATVFVAVLDSAITLRFGDDPLGALPHVVGIFAILALAVFTWQDVSLDKAKTK